ncbi:MAG: M3 family oligoendopeptidase [Armatimonadetes bacterium]|nr:M3 family oligoendopeptidase [Armatimonadota bacterium]
MSLLPFGQLAPFKERTFVPADADLSSWDTIESLYDRLEEQAAQASTLELFQKWICNHEEMGAALDEQSTRLYIAMTCHTDSEEAKEAYLRFVEQIEPRIKPREFKLSQIYVQHPLRSQLPTPRYEIYDRYARLHVELFREENVPLQTEEAKLEQQYQELSGSLTVSFRSEEMTLTQMGKFLEEPDRALRQEVWELVSARRLQERERFEEIFDQLVKIREQIAHNAGFENYRDYAFKAKARFDYTPQDCLSFHEAVERSIMPAVRKLQAERRGQMNVGALRPWDMAVDPLNRPALKPFENVGELVSKTQAIFERLDGGLSRGFGKMRDLHLLDLDNRKGKAPGGYQSTLSEARLPFIFMNAVGVQRDVETMLHESGHAFHALATQDEDLFTYRHAPLEFCEVASMSMELLGSEFLEEFYPRDEADRARKTHLEGIISFFPWMATVDAFQHWIYTHPGHSREERTRAFEELMNRFGGDVDYSGYEEARANLWHRQLHIFLSPFYYVEYGIAQLGALQVWRNSRQDKVKALRDYQTALELGGSRPLPDLFERAGCQFRFDTETIEPLMRLIAQQLDHLARSTAQ